MMNGAWANAFGNWISYNLAKDDDRVNNCKWPKSDGACSTDSQNIRWGVEQCPGTQKFLLNATNHASTNQYLTCATGAEGCWTASRLQSACDSKEDTISGTQSFTISNSKAPRSNSAAWVPNNNCGITPQFTGDENNKNQLYIQDYGEVGLNWSDTASTPFKISYPADASDDTDENMGVF